MMTWTHDTEYDFDRVDGQNCYITLEKRPGYCDRGNFIAKIFLKNPIQTPEQIVQGGRATSRDFKLEIDGSDGWPRYYFDEGRAKAEIEAWLVKRKEAP